MKLNGVVHTSSVLIMMMVFLSITVHAISEDRKCLHICLGGCGLPPTKECIERCYSKCAAAEAPTVVDQTIHYCKLGCSLHHCAKYNFDKTKMERCVDHCSSKYCNIEHLY
ncbi:hypothetical protein ACFX2C_038419 [Malus domestica]